jgi:vacuolar protein sorting-associated protein 13A/C
MFEGLLEKILLAKIGKYIVGLDKDNLKIGVWGGDITLENVYLKPDALLLLQLPLLILYGKIIKLVIKVPWSKLSSSPVEVRLEGLSVILSTPQKQNWNYSEEGDIINRKELIEAHEQRLKQLQDQKLLSAEEELKEKSFLEKMSSKVLDNIRIVIQDIHLRFESSIDGRIFASGLTLEKIECFTTNSEWTPEFTDRHKAGFAGQRIFKVINVQSLGFYWKSGDESLQGDEPLLAARMLQMIKSPEIRDYLITPSKV